MRASAARQGWRSGDVSHNSQLTRQVLVVTHLPQIACFADLHVRVRKGEGEATAEVLDDRERLVELSRMLAGMEASEHALSHAEELLDEAARVRAEVS